jgi:hypothetical protein
MAPGAELQVRSAKEKKIKIQKWMNHQLIHTSLFDDQDYT